MADPLDIRSRKLPVIGCGLEVELKADGSYVVFAGSRNRSRAGTGCAAARHR
jgi:hypothetical protein